MTVGISAAYDRAASRLELLVRPSACASSGWFARVRLSIFEANGVPSAQVDAEAGIFGLFEVVVDAQVRRLHAQSKRGPNHGGRHPRVLAESGVPQVLLGVLNDERVRTEADMAWAALAV